MYNSFKNLDHKLTKDHCADLLLPISNDITNVLMNMHAVETPEAKRAMTKIYGHKCVESVNKLFDILNGRDPTCDYF
jgi:hypothetical protein